MGSVKSTYLEIIYKYQCKEWGTEPFYIISLSWKTPFEGGLENERLFWKFGGGMIRDVYVTTSWDDGYHEDLKLVRLLDTYHLKGSFYIPIKSIKSNLTLENIRKIARNHELGAHTVNHVNLIKQSIKNAKYEITQSKIELEEIIEDEVKMFCYPYGHYNSKIIQLVKSAGFIGARTVDRLRFDVTDRYQFGTTLQVLMFKRDLFAAILKIGTRKIIVNFSNWEGYAKLLFDYVLANGGIFSLWGHSWEIEKYGYWEELEHLFQYITKHSGIHYVTNGELIEKYFNKLNFHELVV